MPKLHQAPALDLRPLFADLVESSADAIFACSLDRLVLMWNGAARRVYGYERNEAVGLDLTELFPEDHRAELDQVWDRVRGGVADSRFVTLGRRKSGELMRVSMSVSPVHNESGDMVAVSFIARDITDRLERADARVQAAEQAERAKTSLIGTVSHELRTPLAAIRGYISTIVDYDARLTNEEKQNYLRSVDEAAKRLERICTDLLTLSRLDSGILDLNVELTNLSGLLRLVASSHEFIAPDHPIRVSAPRKRLQASFDPFRIRQVLTNLLDNAVKYSRTGSRIELAARPADDDAVEIVIRDHGPGVPVMALDSIFESFYRVPTAAN